MSQVCAFSFFSPTDRSNTATTWDSDGSNCLQGQGSASMNIMSISSIWFQNVKSCQSSSMYRKQFSNEYLLKHLKEKIYTYKWELDCWRFYEMFRNWPKMRFSQYCLQLVVSMGQSMWTKFLHSLPTMYRGVKCHQRSTSFVCRQQSFNVLVVGSGSLFMLLSCPYRTSHCSCQADFFPGEF